ncbi:RHS repeat domain-containing protein [Marinicella sediminis]|uniref:RHS repeat domain-containing protein n=1 Tax=Marinicella sediminis TaxID=1792834 RepID=A0ABV7JI76_9GAMM|nr:RHS repeat-associated core domain-containing protein [Marinicella sediminis]
MNLASNNSVEKSFQYDDVGNQIVSDGRVIEYTPFNKASYLSEGGHSVEFVYGANNEKIIRKDTTDGETTLTWYIGNVEIINEGWADGMANSIKVKRYLGDSVVTHNNLSNIDVQYIHKDHLGSTQVITNQLFNGNVTRNLSYDVFGKRRSLGSPDYKLSFNPVDGITNYGFTGQSHIDKLGLVNFKARLYDPDLGMMLQADTVIPPGSVVDSLNRYAYVFNNPLSYTDPTGHVPMSNALTEVAANIIEIDRQVAEKAKQEGTTKNKIYNELRRATTRTPASGVNFSTFDSENMGQILLSEDNTVSNCIEPSLCDVTEQPEPSYECLSPMRSCSEVADDYLTELDKKGGLPYQWGFNSVTEANMAAAETFGPAAQESNREVNWYAFKNKNTGLWGFTYPGVGKKGSKSSKKPWQIRRRFDKNNKIGLTPNSLGHSHFDDNLSFSLTDLYSFVGQAGTFTLLNKHGDLSWTSATKLSDLHGIKDKEDVKKLEHEKNIGGPIQDTGVYGLFLGNIYD